MVNVYCKNKSVKHPIESDYSQIQRAIHLAEVQRMVDALIESGAFCDVDITDEFIDELFLLATLCSFRRKCETGDFSSNKEQQK